MLSQIGLDALTNVKVIEHKVFIMLMTEEKKKVMEYSGRKKLQDNLTLCCFCPSQIPHPPTRP